jgi:hypothetical protein
MAELADAADSKSADPCDRGGSTPPPGTNVYTFPHCCDHSSCHEVRGLDDHNDPLYQSFNRWQWFKVATFEAILAGNAPEANLRVLEAAEQIGDWAKVASASFTALSFLHPS